MKLQPIEIVSATRLSEGEFWTTAALGISLRRLAKDPRLVAYIAFNNTHGLSEVFNARIEALNHHDILILIHDDVWIDDDLLTNKVIEGLKNFDVLGVAGNRYKVKNQPAWSFIDFNFTKDIQDNLSGCVAHGKYPFGVVSEFGPAPVDCELLDGLFLAARKSKLKMNGVKFDPCFDFHFYDMDFCRCARENGLRLGTWPICLTHQSVGAFDSQAWKNKMHLYLDKWERRGGSTSIKQSTTGIFNYLIRKTTILNWPKSVFSNSDSTVYKNDSILFGDGEIPQVDPQNEFSAYLKCGNELLANGNLTGAAASYGAAIAINPSDADGFLNLSFVLNEQGLHQGAEHYLTHALFINPDMEDAYYLLGTILLKQGKLDLAILNFNKALELKPDFEIVYRDLCNALFHIGKIEMAKNVIEKALALNSQCAEFHFYQGNLFSHEKQMRQAITCYQKALLLQPDFLQVHTNMGNVLMQMGQVDEAIDSYEKALSISPDSIEAESCLLFIRASHSQYTPDQYLTAAKSYGIKVGALAKPYTQWPFINFADSSGKPLRVGLVSGDFNNHPVGFFLESTLQYLNTDRIELVAYHSSSQEDENTARLKSHFSTWISIVGLSDEAAAHKIHADGIHILIDLAGHTTYNRLPLFAWKPAPVQVSWLGYFASTGVPGMDFLLADPESVPESHRRHFTEQVWYLATTRMCFTPPTPVDKSLPAPLPSMRNGYVTYGCFQNLTKISDAVLSVWARIFQSLPQAKLRLQNKQITSVIGSREDIHKRLSRFGIEPERVLLEDFRSRNDYLAAHAEVDIILDTFPYPGGTTTCEALWMGVPTVTLAGNTMLSRQGASLLSCAGLIDWIACDEENYVARALAHASDIQKLAQLRGALRQKVFNSPLFDAPCFALNLEEALIKIWQQKLDMDTGLATAKD